MYRVLATTAKKEFWMATQERNDTNTPHSYEHEKTLPLFLTNHNIPGMAMKIK
jgi:hypothetical protein